MTFNDNSYLIKSTIYHLFAVILPALFEIGLLVVVLLIELSV